MQRQHASRVMQHARRHVGQLAGTAGRRPGRAMRCAAPTPLRRAHQPVVVVPVPLPQFRVRDVLPCTGRPAACPVIVQAELMHGTTDACCKPGRGWAPMRGGKTCRAGSAGFLTQDEVPGDDPLQLQDSAGREQRWGCAVTARQVQRHSGTPAPQLPPMELTGSHQQS